MKYSCHDIEPILYLFREGELTSDERAKVIAHLDECPACRSTIADLHSIDTALDPVRKETPAMAGGRNFAGNVIAVLSRGSGRRFGYFPESFSPGKIFGWVRPALSFALLSLAVLFLVQEYRDAARVAELEQRLADLHPVTGNAQTDITNAGRFPSRLMSPGNLSQIDPLSIFKTFLPEINGRQEGLFDELAGKYPNLARISLKRGLDDNDRRILASEGEAFLHDVERLVREGARQP